MCVLWGGGGGGGESTCNYEDAFIGRYIRGDVAPAKFYGIQKHG